MTGYDIVGQFCDHPDGGPPYLFLRSLESIHLYATEPLPGPAGGCSLGSPRAIWYIQQTWSVFSRAAFALGIAITF
jgi:hypothetical protein